MMKATMLPTKCKVCGGMHWLSEPHIFGSKPYVPPKADLPPVRARESAVKRRTGNGAKTVP